MGMKKNVHGTNQGCRGKISNLFIGPRFAALKHCFSLFLLSMTYIFGFFCPAISTGGEKEILAWVHPYMFYWRVHRAIALEHSWDDQFQLMENVGITEFLIFDLGASSFHPTTVRYAFQDPCSKPDMLKDILEAAQKHHISVWLNWTPADRYAEKPPAALRAAREKAGFYLEGSKGRKLHDYALDMKSPAVRKYYHDMIDELARNYSKYKSLKGILWHESHLSEGADSHRDDIESFRQFCKERFGEDYNGPDMPPKTNAKDKWWRRYVLYKNDLMNSFIKEMADQSHGYNLQTGFVFYAPESYSMESWKWGYDALELEKLCNKIWFLGNSRAKHYHSFRGAWFDFGPSYKKNNLAMNYSMAFHGRPLSIFEWRIPVYLKEYRAFGASDKKLTKTYGDIYNGLHGHSDQELSVFFGQDNMKKWLSLMSFWQGGESPASLAYTVSPNAFVLQHPSPGTVYREKVLALIDQLSSSVDIDGIVTGSTNMKNNLERYKLIIFPEDMDHGMDEKAYHQYYDYVRNGGKLLLIKTPLSIGHDDLTELQDKSVEFCGVRIDGRDIPGNVIMQSDVQGLTVPDKIIHTVRTSLSVDGGEVLVWDKDTQIPLLIRNKIGKGEVYFSSLGYSPELGPYFSSLVQMIEPSPVSLRDSRGMTILESVIKDNILCVALWGHGTGILKVDVGRIGLKGDSFLVKDIISGKVVAELSRVELERGGPVKIMYENQPYVLAVGQKTALDVWRGIIPSENVFKEMNCVRIVENQEVPIAVPAGDGIRIGVYHGGRGAENIIRALEKQKMRVFELPRLDREALYSCDVVILPQFAGEKFFNQSLSDIRRYVQDGGGVCLTHDAVGFRGHLVAFPEIGKGTSNPRQDILRIAKEHEAIGGLKSGKIFSPAFKYDHVSIEKGKLGETLVVDDQGNAVVVAGKIGKGKVILNGMLTGMDGEQSDSEGEPQDTELEILVNTVKWLGQK